MGFFDLFGRGDNASLAKRTYPPVQVTDAQQEEVDKFCRKLVRRFFPGTFDMDWDLFKCRYIGERLKKPCLLAYMAMSYRVCEGLFDAYIDSGLIVAENLYPSGNELGEIFDRRRREVLSNFLGIEEFRRYFYGLIKPTLSRMARRRYTELPEVFKHVDNYYSSNAPTFRMLSSADYWESVKLGEIFVVRYIYETFTKPSDSSPATIVEWRAWVKKWSEVDGEYGIGRTFALAMGDYFDVVCYQGLK